MAPPAIVNAVVDALAPFGIPHVDMPLTPEKILARDSRDAAEGGPIEPVLDVIQDCPSGPALVYK